MGMPIVLEKQVGPIYHFTTMQGAWSILSDGELRPKGEGDFYASDGGFVIDRPRDWVSFTRNKDLRVTPATGAVSRSGQPWGEVRLEFDGDRLAHNHRVRPFHDDDGKLTRQDGQAEERIDGVVKVGKAVTGLTFHYDLYMRNQTDWDRWVSVPDAESKARYTKMAREDAVAFVRECRKMGIPVTLKAGS
jgi:hypothetical protein